jgi:hypothetical protein
MTYRNSLNGLNPRHHHLPDELKAAILAKESVDYAFYLKYKGDYSSKSLRVKFDCEVCGDRHESDFKHLNKRKVVTGAICPKCVTKVVSTDIGWRERNSEAQLKIQSLPETKAKNAAGVSKFWAENPDKLAAMRESVIAANKREDVRERLLARQAWNGRGISGDYLSRWGWLRFDSSYELATLLALERNESVRTVRRGPVIEYEFDGARRYFVDYEIAFHGGAKWWCEVKSGYIGKHREKIDKLRAKLSKAIELIRLGHADKIVLVTEKSSQEILGVKMPRGTDRNAMFKKYSKKIIFARQKDEERYK